jgi:hypothetical protein
VDDANITGSIVDGADTNRHRDTDPAADMNAGRKLKEMLEKLLACYYAGKAVRECVRGFSLTTSSSTSYTVATGASLNGRSH